MTIIAKTILKYLAVYAIGSFMGATACDMVNKLTHEKNVKSNETVGTFVITDGDIIEQNGELKEKMDVSFVPNDETYHKLIDKVIDGCKVNANVNIQYINSPDINKRVVAEVDTDKVA